jgi:hypothetical protein
LKPSRPIALSGKLPPASAVALPHDYLAFIDFEAGHFEMLDHPLCQLLPSVVGDMLF